MPTQQREAWKVLQDLRSNTAIGKQHILLDHGVCLFEFVHGDVIWILRFAVQLEFDLR